MEYNFNEVIRNELVVKLKDLVAAKQIQTIRDVEEDYTGPDFADALETMELSEQLYVLRVLSTDVAAEVYSYLEDETKVNLALSFTEDWGLKILNELQTDELRDVLEDLPVNVMRKILSVTDAEKREKINNLLQYDDTQIGSWMTVDLSILRGDYTVKKALAKIKRDYKSKKEIVHNFYITDRFGMLLGDITLEELVFANEDDYLVDLYNVVASVNPEQHKEQAALIFANQDRSTLPVVSKDNRLIGMITADDVIDVLQEQATEDMYKLAGINPHAADESYLKTTLKQIVKSRVFWLLILMISATLSQYIIQQFTEISETFISQSLNISISTAIIVGLIPIISGSAGNAGSQSSTTITRAAALGEISSSDVKKVLWKEFTVGFTIGGIMFLANIARLYLYFAIPAFRDNTAWANISFVIVASSLSLMVVVIIAKLLGSIIPLVAIKYKKDPAVMSAPILTTLSDALSTLIFFGLNLLVLWAAAKLNLVVKATPEELAKVSKELAFTASEIHLAQLHIAVMPIISF